ncbi:MAG: serine protease [Nanoarchaeota archaeon]|nr:serine protease [Nanoarchaeota archaeon]
MNDLPVSTKWLIDSIGESGRKLISSVFMVLSKKTNEKGTGFLYREQYVITNWHVIKDSRPEELLIRSGFGEEFSVIKIVVDKNRDLALLSLNGHITEGSLEIDTTSEIKPGLQVSTWGFPLAYNGPSPLLSVGHIAGFREHREANSLPIIKRIVVNGAFNPGNSGGPLFVSGNNKVVGVVVSKHVPFTPFLLSSLDVLAKNQSGVVFTGRDEAGNERNFVESQIVAELLNHFRVLTQVMI